MALIDAMRLCSAFTRCMNYPKDEDGVAALARGLMWAASSTDIPMHRIVEECCRISMYCPTDADMLTVARDIRGPEQAEEIPIPSPDTVRKQWQALAHQFPHIMENGRLWQEQYKLVCARIKTKMGSEKWDKATSREKVRVGIEMGLQVHIQPPLHATIEDMGVGIFVPRSLL